MLEGRLPGAAVGVVLAKLFVVPLAAFHKGVGLGEHIGQQGEVVVFHAWLGFQRGNKINRHVAGALVQ